MQGICFVGNLLTDIFHDPMSLLPLSQDPLFVNAEAPKSNFRDIQRFAASFTLCR